MSDSRNERNGIEVPELEGSTQTSRPNGWKIVFGFYGALVIIVFALTMLYRAQPKSSGIVQKRTVPATQSVFVAVLSPLRNQDAAHIARDVSTEIGADSALTRMVLGGTHVYKECTSLADFSTLLQKGIINARPRDLETQAKLLAQITGRVMADQLPAKVYLVGNFANDEYQVIKNRLKGICDVMEMRNTMNNTVEIIAYNPPGSGDSPRESSLRSRILDSFRDRGITLSER